MSKQKKGSKKAEETGAGEFIPAPKDFDKAMSSVKKREEKVPCPELNDVFGAPQGQTVTFVVQQCDLSTYLKLQAERQGVTQTLITGLVKALEDQDDKAVSDMFNKYYFGGDKELSPQARFEIEICLSCVKEPKLKRIDWIRLADMFPWIVNRLSNKIIDLTIRGGVKKN